MLNVSITDVFENVGMSYHFETKESYDNIESMEIFISKCSELEGRNIFIEDGTLIVLEHTDYDYKVRLDSGGDGDFFHHRIDTDYYVD